MEIQLANLDRIANCLTDNSKFSDSIPAWL